MSFLIVLLLLALICGLTLTVVGLPGNWLMVIAVVAYTALGSSESPYAFSWGTVGLIAAIALVGEIIEMFASLMGVKRLGGSRRAMMMAMIGSIVGGIVGITFGTFVPIPILGPLLSLLLFAAVGAFVGAVSGELWKTRAARRSLKVGIAAMIGRLLGTAGKLLAGVLIFCTVVIIWIGAWMGV